MAAMYITEKPIYELSETLLSRLYGIALAAQDEDDMLYYASFLCELYKAGRLKKTSELVREVFKEGKVM